MYRITIVTLFALFAITVTASGMDSEGGIRLTIGSPTGEFGEAVKDPGVGFAGHFGLRPLPLLTIGLGLDFLIYGSETHTYHLPLVEDLDMETNNNLAGISLFVQCRPFVGPFQPYVEARAGYHYLWTESKLKDQDEWDDDEVASKTNYDDVAGFYGGGGGLLIRLKKWDKASSMKALFLDFKITRLIGARAEYLSEGDIKIVDLLPVFDASNSETDLTTFELGVVATF